MLVAAVVIVALSVSRRYVIDLLRNQMDNGHPLSLVLHHIMSQPRGIHADLTVFPCVFTSHSSPRWCIPMFLSCDWEQMFGLSWQDTEIIVLQENPHKHCYCKTWICLNINKYMHMSSHTAWAEYLILCLDMSSKVALLFFPLLLLFLMISNNKLWTHHSETMRLMPELSINALGFSKQDTIAINYLND